MNSPSDCPDPEKSKRQTFHPLSMNICIYCTPSQPHFYLIFSIHCCSDSTPNKHRFSSRFHRNYIAAEALFHCIDSHRVSCRRLYVFCRGRDCCRWTYKASREWRSVFPQLFQRLFLQLFLLIISINMLNLIGLIMMMVGVAQSTIIVTSPLVTDFDNNTINYFYANFGEVPYGKSLTYELIVLDHGLCGNPNEMEKLTKPTYVAISIKSGEYCSYTKRAEVAQRIGAKGLIIADGSQAYPDEAGKAIEADDGNGKKIHIVCLFITPQSFEILTRLNMVQIMAKFPVPKAKVSTVTLFISAAKRATYVFLRKFREEYNHLKNHTKLQLVYHTMECPYCSSQNCYFNTYCSYDYQYYQDKMGQKIISEQLHQYAIFHQKGVDKWMDYMDAFDEYCDGDWNNLEECTRSVKKKISMDAVAVTDPVDRTLAHWRVREVHLGFDSFPEIAVNSMIYRGNFEVDDIILTICSSLQKPPKYCKEKQSKEQTTPKNTNDSVIMILMVAVVSLLVLVGCTICCYRRFIRNELTRDMASKVGQIIAGYASKLGKSKKKGQELVEVAPDQL